MLNIAVEYSNMKAWSVPGDFVYRYRANLVKGSAFKMTGTFYQPFRSSRVLAYAHGILLQATVSGTAQVPWQQPYTPRPNHRAPRPAPRTPHPAACPCLRAYARAAIKPG